MEFGIFHEFLAAGASSQSEAFAQSFAQIEAAERWGLDVVFLAEIHMNPTRCLSTAPLTLASAVAARTQRIKVGTAVQVLPLGHPLRLAEETATIDLISGGRFVFGIGRSAFPRAYNAYGIAYQESQDRFAESLDIIKLAWTAAGIVVSAGPIGASRILPSCRARCSSRIRQSASPRVSLTPMRPSAGWATRCSRRCAPARWTSCRPTSAPIAMRGGKPVIRDEAKPIFRCRSMSPRHAGAGVVGSPGGADAICDLSR